MPSPPDAQERLLADLTTAQQVLEEMGSDFSRLKARMGELRGRLEEGRFRLAVLGQFKRGKSSLLNALLGEPLLPTGVLPLTTIPTVLRHGPERRVRVTLLDGRCEDHRGPVEALVPVLMRYVTERENPANRLGVTGVEVEHPAAFLAQGVEIIDTPGIGSTVPHNTRTARGVLPVCDGAVFILSPDPPITEVEVQFLKAVKDAVARVVLVVTKVDLLPTPERQEVLSFLQRVLHEQVGYPKEERILMVSARQALEARMTEETSLWSESGIAALKTYLTDFLVTDKQAALQEAVRAKAARLIGETLFAMDLQRKAIELPRQDLERRSERFEAQLTKLERERVHFRDRLAGDRQRLLAELDQLAEAIVGPATKALTACIDRVREEAGPDTACTQLTRRIHASLSEEVDHVFGRATNDMLATVATQFQSIQDTHCRDMESLIERIRQTAADLFEVPCLEGVVLDRLEVIREPRVIGQRWVTSFTEEAASWIDLLLPRSWRAKRLERRLHETTEYLVARNVEEQRWAIRQNLEETFRTFQTRMEVQLEATISGIRTAIWTALDRQAQRERRSTPESEKLKGFRQRLEHLVAELSPPGKPASYGSPV